LLGFALNLIQQERLLALTQLKHLGTNDLIFHKNLQRMK
jgi:hypothetical protein